LLFSENFETGTIGGFDSETDTASQLDIVHYKTLGRYPWPNCTPYSGAYCMRLVLTGSTADATLSESSVDIADGVTNYFIFDVYFAPNFAATADDIFQLVELQGAAAAITASFGVQITAATQAIQLGIGSAASAGVPNTFMSAPIERDTWYTVELKMKPSTTGTGTLDMFVTRAGDPTQQTAQAALTGKTNIVVTDAVVGVQNQLATTTGVILLDKFAFSDVRIYPRERYTQNPTFIQSAHAFVGPGYIDGAAILDGTTPTMKLWDTDSADTSGEPKVWLATGATNQSSIGGHIFFSKGCYVELGGTTPLGQVIFVTASKDPGVFGPLYYSDSGVRRLARAA
jgi:hypothetical protein